MKFVLTLTNEDCTGEPWKEFLNLPAAKSIDDANAWLPTWLNFQNQQRDIPIRVLIVETDESEPSRADVRGRLIDDGIAPENIQMATYPPEDL